MSDLNMYAFYDKKSQNYDTPFFALDNLHAKRHFYIVSEKEGSMLNTFLSDFEIYLIAQFNKKNGSLNPEPKPILIMSGNQLIKDKKAQTE